MPALARNFRVIAVDQRGMGRSGTPTTGYDAAQLANDQIALMHALGHRSFAVVGHDTGMVVAYALAADHPNRVTRLVVIDAPLPGVAPSPALLVPPALNDRLYLSFNQLASVNEQLVRGREDIFFGFEFATFAAKPLPSSATRYYISGFASSREALSASFGFYRALWTTTGQNAQRMTRRLTLPVLAIGGAQSLGESPANAMRRRGAHCLRALAGRIVRTATPGTFPGPARSCAPQSGA
jgi:pimeloyl-ACP methyl ester carboxylesterase